MGMLAATAPPIQAKLVAEGLILALKEWLRPAIDARNAPLTGQILQVRAAMELRLSSPRGKKGARFKVEPLQQWNQD